MIKYTYLALKRFLLKQICLNNGLGLDIYKEISKHIKDHKIINLMNSYNYDYKNNLYLNYLNDNKIVIYVNENKINCKIKDKYNLFYTENNMDCHFHNYYYNIKKNKLKIISYVIYNNITKYVGENIIDLF
jgi:hypothetical protein